MKMIIVWLVVFSLIGLGCLLYKAKVDENTSRLRELVVKQEMASLLKYKILLEEIRENRISNAVECLEISLDSGVASLQNKKKIDKNA